MLEEQTLSASAGQHVLQTSRLRSLLNLSTSSTRALPTSESRLDERGRDTDSAESFESCTEGAQGSLGSHNDAEDMPRRAARPPARRPYHVYVLAPSLPDSVKSKYTEHWSLRGPDARGPKRGPGRHERSPSSSTEDSEEEETVAGYKEGYRDDGGTMIEGAARETTNRLSGERGDGRELVSSSYEEEQEGVEQLSSEEEPMTGNSKGKAVQANHPKSLHGTKRVKRVLSVSEDQEKGAEGLEVANLSDSSVEQPLWQKTRILRGRNDFTHSPSLPASFHVSSTMSAGPSQMRTLIHHVSTPSQSRARSFAKAPVSQSVTATISAVTSDGRTPSPFSSRPVKRKLNQVLSSSTSSSEDELSLSKPVKNTGRPAKQRVIKIVTWPSDADSDSDYQQSAPAPAPRRERGFPPGRKKLPSSARSSEVPTEEPNEELLWKHISLCDKCGDPPASDMLRAAMAAKRRKGRKRQVEEFDISDTERAENLGAWVECKSCCQASHWACLGAATQKAYLARHPRCPRDGPYLDKTVQALCARCAVNPACFVCLAQHDVPPKDSLNGVTANGHVPESASVSGAQTPVDDDPGETKIVDKFAGQLQHAETEERVEQVAASESPTPLLFRCQHCKRSAHYHHLRNPFDHEAAPAQLARHYQSGATRPWGCPQCQDWPWVVDKIIAWRSSLTSVVIGARHPGESAQTSHVSRNEYLVKWMDRSFRHVTWIPHDWLIAMSPSKLRSFLEQGPSLDLVTNETLAARGDDMANPSISAIFTADDLSRANGRGSSKSGPVADPDAESSIPVGWKTADRLLDVYLYPPTPEQVAALRLSRHIYASKATSKRKGSDPGETDDEDWSLLQQVPSLLKDGIEPDNDDKVDVATWESLSGVTVTITDADQLVKYVNWCLVKWEDLQYDQSCWDTPPPAESPLYPNFVAAFMAYLRSRKVVIPVLTAKLAEKRDAEAFKIFRTLKEQPSCIVGGDLMPFQLEGLQWLVYKHSLRQSCILADDMGLGKTVQIASLLGYLGSARFSIFPSLVIVPNSTIVNWVREFEKWVPHLRVVPFFGLAASRKIILKYELFHKGLAGKATALKAHVVLTTYDTITGGDFKIFKNIPRWEMLIIDEGQRLKSDSSKIFKQLKQLNSVHRILLTGTPLNNNLRELFNLLNFLDPENFSNLQDLEERFASLDDANVQELHSMIKPYILRRIKADVLKLPPKSEIIVPISLRPLQKQLYKGILEKNADLIAAILAGRRAPGKR